MMVFNEESDVSNQAIVLSGDRSIGGKIKAAYRGGSGTLQFTRTPIAGGASQDIGAPVASGSTYTILSTDRKFRIGARPVTFLPDPAYGIEIPATAPLAPTITGVALGDRSITVTFTRSVDDGGDAVIEDRAYVMSATTKSVLATAAGASPLTVPGVPNGVPIYVVVASINTVSRGLLSSQSAPVAAGILPVPNGYEKFESETGFTFAAVANHRVTTQADGSSAIELSGNGSPGTLTAVKRAFTSMVPSSAGVITVALNKLSKSNLGYGLSVSSGGKNPNAQLIGDSPTKFAMGRRYISMHISEFTDLVPLGAGTIDIGYRLTQSSPYDGKVEFSDARIQSAGFATFVLRYDDGYESQFTFAAVDLENHGFRGSFFLAADRVGMVGGISLPMYKALYARGHDINCDSSPSDAAAIITGYPDAQLGPLFIDGFADGVTKGRGLNANRKFIVDNGLATRGDGAENIFCWANGIWNQALVDAAKAAGYTLAFTTEPQTVHTNRGFGDIGLTLPAKSTSASSVTWAQLKALVDLAVLRGDTLVIYMHALLIGATQIHMEQSLHTQLLDYLKTYTDAGQAVVLTASQLYLRDGSKK